MILTPILLNDIREAQLHFYVPSNGHENLTRVITMLSPKSKQIHKKHFPIAILNKLKTT